MAHNAVKSDNAHPNDVKIYFCPRFHVNFYHSYRGDTPDERGFGKDIRIIRSILDNLDALTVEGIKIKCAWDFDNAFTLGRILPENAPDIVERIKARVSAHLDEIEIMSWNNGLLSAHTAEEFGLALSWAISAPDGSGVLQQFGSFAPIARPQECMFTSEHIDLYRSLGIEAISLYYSAIPFNGFGSFVPRMPAWKRFNPLTLRNPRTGATMRLMPAINQGDIAEYFLSARRMLVSIRREQLAETDRRDMLIVLDMDADDSFWFGMAPGLLRALVPSFGGLFSLMKSIARLPFVAFTRPWEYMSTHPDVGELSIGQDIADGTFDGYASWAEKYENYEIWTTIARAREVWEEGKNLALHGASEPTTGDAAGGACCASDWMTTLPSEVRDLAMSAIAERLRSLSTTHFGMAAPVMNVSRLEKARESANSALDLARKFRDAVTQHFGQSADVAHAEGIPGGTTGSANAPRVSNSPLELDIDAAGSASFTNGAHRVTVSTPWVEYGGRIRKSSGIIVSSEDASGFSLPTRRCRGYIRLSASGQPRVEWEREFSWASSHFARISCSVQYPSTEHRGYDRAKSIRLERTWDARWRQAAPLEIRAFSNMPLNVPIHVWKEDFNGHISTYALDYARYGGNTCLADISNHMTPLWIALSDGMRGILIAQNSPGFRSYAFCPLRQRILGDRQEVTLYPFGALWGSQYRYPARVSGIGRLAAILTADHLFSSAPSWEGKAFNASILIALYDGDTPPESLLREMQECFSSST